MDDIDLGDKKTQIILILLFVIIGSYIYIFFFQEDKYKIKIVKEEVPVIIEKIKEITAPISKKIRKEEVKIEKKKVIKPLEEKEELIKEPIIEDKLNILFRTSSMSHMHNIKVISEIKIEKDDNLDYNFVVIEGNVINYDEVDGRFSIFIRDDYLEYLSQVSIEVEDKISKTTSRCDASFLIGINKNDFYKFAFDDGACYITDTNPESVFFKTMREKIKPVHKMSEEEFKKLPEETPKKKYYKELES